MEMELLKEYFKDEGGMGTVEVILIIVVLVGLVIIFKDNITEIINTLFDKITKKTNSF
jgi:Flp pilus assembly pilin Flp